MKSSKIQNYYIIPNQHQQIAKPNKLSQAQQERYNIEANPPFISMQNYWLLINKGPESRPQ